MSQNDKKPKKCIKINNSDENNISPRSFAGIYTFTPMGTDSQRYTFHSITTNPFWPQKKNQNQKIFNNKK